MNLQITGGLRDIANSAWVSTMDEAKALQKSDEEVKRVVDFLIENHHTTPFESVTMTFSFKEDSSEENSNTQWDLSCLIGSKYCRASEDEDDSGNYSAIVTTDLFNFVKTTKYFGGENFENSELWKAFKNNNPELYSFASRICIPPEYDGGMADVSSIIGNTNISVDLVSFHDMNNDEHSRATWRVHCPLSIAVQMLRHRSGSFNMTSGRYRTLNQDMIVVPADIAVLLENNDSESKTDEFLKMISYESTAKLLYEDFMSEIKTSYKGGEIKNSEYKRLREFVRFILPEGRMTELYVSFYLNDFKKYLYLRDSEHAQLEHVYVAQQMKKTLNEKLKNKI